MKTDGKIEFRIIRLSTVLIQQNVGDKLFLLLNFFQNYLAQPKKKPHFSWNNQNLFYIFFVIFRHGKYMACCMLYRGDVVPKVNTLPIYLSMYLLIHLLTYQLHINPSFNQHTYIHLFILLSLNLSTCHYIYLSCYYLSIYLSRM